MTATNGCTGQSVHVSLKVEVRNKDGNRVRDLPDPAGGTFEAAGDFDRLMPEEGSSFALLGSVDRYGDTVFEASQMAGLLAEVEQLAASDAGVSERRGLDRLRVMAERCRGDDLLQLWFVGD
jgi:hypothetical protein